MTKVKFIPVCDLSTIRCDQQGRFSKNTDKESGKTKRFTVKSVIKLLFVLSAFALIFNSMYIHVKAYMAQYLLARAWQHNSATHQQKPWPWLDTYPVEKLHFPSLGDEHIVLAGDSGQALAFGPGLSHLSVKPGEPGTIVIAGHRDTHFNTLQYLNPSEQIVLENAAGEQHHYQIDHIGVLDVNEDEILQTSYERLVLITCYPFDSDTTGTSLRYVVQATSIAQQPKKLLLAKQGRQEYLQKATINF
ncbi:sortase, marine proteobacterial type [Thalassotalea sp. 42_200_T64]|nr:sortase, marine proteobacterial type [Thalassotalea sp. 42_200_T64]